MPLYSDLQDSPMISLEDYLPSNEWEILAHPGKKNVNYYPCCPTPFPDLTFSVVIKRQVRLSFGCGSCCKGQHKQNCNDFGKIVIIEILIIEFENFSLTHYHLDIECICIPVCPQILLYFEILHCLDFHSYD